MMKLTYRGETPAIHPELGLLTPGESTDVAERDVPAALRAAAAGLPLDLWPIVDDEPAGEIIEEVEE